MVAEEALADATADAMADAAADVAAVAACDESNDNWGTYRFNEPGDYTTGWKARVPTSTLYTASLYWAITTMATVGYGDILPRTKQEIGFSIFVMFVGASIFGYILGTVSITISNADPYERETKRRLVALKDYMESSDSPDYLKRLMRKQFKFHYKVKGI